MSGGAKVGRGGAKVGTGLELAFDFFSGKKFALTFDIISDFRSLFFVSRFFLLWR